ncbi:hypothetical protein [Bacteroides stercorirosoris]|uniref:Uncharacterized protein n=1 Tax=Bacteroides stercorirosoris TaxID=871324 RepID=A0A1M6L5U9_9BACE|nr:hypothetical protein [Bacteroides stercorirosoris]SHJ66572.1 hypothetical protein SAMN05444350_14438 [Bacteroides stercorirosoris]
MSQKERKQKRIKKIMDDAAKALEAEGVKYFIGVTDREPKKPTEGQVYIQSDVQGEDFCYILDFALPTRQDLINMGIWLGQIIKSREKKK